MGLSLNVVGLGFGITLSQEQLVDVINSNDLVITLGRGLQESLACGRPVLISDYSTSDGLHSSGHNSCGHKCNFSGRWNKYPITKDHIKEELSKYNQLVKMHDNVDNFMKENRLIANDIKDYAENIIKLSEEINE